MRDDHRFEPIARRHRFETGVLENDAHQLAVVFGVVDDEYPAPLRRSVGVGESADKVRDQGFRSLAVVSSLDTQFAKGSEQAGFSIAVRPVAVERLDDFNEPLLDIAGVTRDLFGVVQHLTEAVTVKRERHKNSQPSELRVVKRSRDGTAHACIQKAAALAQRRFSCASSD